MTLAIKKNDKKDFWKVEQKNQQILIIRVQQTLEIIAGVKRPLTILGEIKHHYPWNRGVSIKFFEGSCFTSQGVENKNNV